MAGTGRGLHLGWLDRPERSALIERIASRVPAIICIVIGGVGMMGWGLGVEFLKNPLPGQVDMKTNTALCFILGGLALLRPGGRPSSVRPVSRRSPC